MPSDESSASSKKFLPELGSEIHSGISIYKLLSVLGEGGFGTVFEVRRGCRRYAMKIEKYSKSMLHVEATVMNAAEKHGCKHIGRVVDYGSYKAKYTFIVMPMLGKDLHTLRHEQIDKRFTISTSILVATQTLQAIQELHRCGFISRDIKPGNFAVGLREDMQHKRIFLFDFGLAKRHSDKYGNVYGSRGVVGWRGTARYGSLNAHQRMDLGRRDDIESWFYLVVEITSGILPWRHVSDRKNVQSAKLMARNKTRIHLLHNCPKQYDGLLTKIDEMLFEDEPNYDYLYRILNDISEENKFSLNAHFDWEQESESEEEDGEIEGDGVDVEGREDEETDEESICSATKYSTTASGDTAIMFNGAINDDFDEKISLKRAKSHQTDSTS